MKKYEVAILYDLQGNIVGGLKCATVSESDYQKLINGAKEQLAVRDNINRELVDSICELNEKIKQLEQEIKVLKGEE